MPTQIVIIHKLQEQCDSQLEVSFTGPVSVSNQVPAVTAL